MKIIRKYKGNVLERKALRHKLKQSKKDYRNYVMQNIFLALNLLWLMIITEIIGALTSNLDFFGVGAVEFVIIFVIFFAVAVPYNRFISGRFKYELPVRVSAETVAEFTAPIRDHYELGDDFVTTKCYHSSLSEFENKDVTLFWCGEELRITVDLFRSMRDIGCVLIPKDELSFSNTKKDGLVCTEIKTEGFEMLLGYRAGTFLRKPSTD